MKKRSKKIALLKTNMPGVYTSVGIEHARGPLDLNAIAGRLADPLVETKKHRGKLPPWPILEESEST